MQGLAPVYSIAEEASARAETAAWSRFTAPADASEFCTSWLALLCTRIERCRAAILLLGEEEQGPYRVNAVWPDRRKDLQHLGAAGERALSERAGVVIAAPSSGGPSQVAYPIEVAQRLWGAVVLELDARGDSGLQRALRDIHWGIAWLIDHFRQRLLAEREATLARVNLLNELVATALQYGQLKPSALAVVNLLARQLQCERVSVGLEAAGHCAPLALSHTASFDARSDLARHIGGAMDEVLDLGIALHHPPDKPEELGTLAHAEMARALQLTAICSVPLRHEGQVLGALVFERNNGPAFDERARLLARAAGELLGPVWVLLRERERPWWQRQRESLRAATQALLGPRHPGLKLLAGTAALTLLVLGLWPVDYRISARTVVEGARQIAAVAPFEGFVAEAPARAGDSVRQGQMLARLDDRDLRLEQARGLAEREQLLRRHQVALASQDRGAMGVIAAQIGQSEAQLALVRERLARATLVAPYDGIVVAGDLSQQIGSPVEQGRVLFELAPASGYRVILQVDERDIGRLALGQRGELVLSGLPGQALALTVRQITPVSTTQDNRNFFRVEAALEASPARLRPGMEGIGKVAVGEERLLWVWTHGFTDWLRLALWNWMP